MTKLYEALVRASEEGAAKEEHQAEFPFALEYAPAAVEADVPGCWPQVERRRFDRTW